ncbi:S8 family serine peptidase, partial [Gorillibacterium massiliense]|uniref:S8 family serine peptidase n=1 Tax=Gorillibacterium massiliense TaxID=1280390 RepID=UPI0005925A1F
DPYETRPDPNDPKAATEHGTHVAGTIAGRGDPTIENNPTGWVKGVAYGADLYAYRVLGPGGTGTSENVIAAVDRAVADGMDVINLSLGDDFDNEVDPTSIALDNAMLSGVVTVVSAGNNGPGDYTLGTPGASRLAVTVGASTPPLNVPVVTGSGLNKLYGSLMSFSPELGALNGMDVQFVYSGMGTTDDFAGKDLTGKVALISRGSISFVEKSINAKNAGAIAAIIYNNKPGNFGGTLGSAGDYIPTFSISDTDGLALKTMLETNPNYTAHFGIEMTQDTLADFSAMGPALPGLDIKPDITAPGVAIRSSIPAYGGDYTDAYADMQGTSMAAPHIAGAAALILQTHPELDPFEVKGLLMNNADQISDLSNKRYSYMMQGAGRVDLNKVNGAGAVALVEEPSWGTGDKTASVSFGKMADGSSASRTIDVTGIQSADYSIAVNWLGDSAGTLTTSQPSISVTGAETKTFDLNFMASGTAMSGYYEAQVVLTPASGSPLTIPVSVYIGDVKLPNTVSAIAFAPTIFSPNNDGVQDSTKISFRINTYSPYFSLDVYSIEGGGLKWEGTMLEETGGISPGSYTINGWDGTVVKGNQVLHLTTNYYLLVPWVGPNSTDIAPITEEAQSFILDVDAPVAQLNNPQITVSNGVGTISGRIVSDFLTPPTTADYSDIGVAALYDGDSQQADGVIANDGTFTIQVPIAPGENTFNVYVYDAAGNGAVTPAFVVNYDNTEVPQVGPVVAKVSASPVAVGQAFDVGIQFPQVSGLYSAQFSLEYDKQLTKGTTTPSVTMATYQEANNPGVSLLTDEKSTDLGNGKIRVDYIVSLLGDMKGYTGSGILANFHFSGQTPGSYDFKLSNVRLLDGDAGDIAISGTTNGAVTIQPVVGPLMHKITGTLTAEAFGSGVDYSKVWYSGSEGEQKVIVEALDGKGTVVSIAEVAANGSYTLTVPDGTYTVRAYVPSHVAKSLPVTVSADTVQNFGVLKAGDVNNDGQINLVDLQLTAKEFGKSKGTGWTGAKPSLADINRDNAVDLLDISYILNNYQIP